MRRMARFALVVIAVLCIITVASPGIRHRIHWIRYGYDSVWYDGRTYMNPNTYTEKQAVLQFGQGQALVPTGDKVIGLPVYDTPQSIAFEKQRHAVPTILFLRKTNGNFIVYELSGGP